MKFSIQFKIVMIYMCTIFLIMLLSGTFIVYNTEERDYKSIQTSMEKLAESIEDRNKWDIEDKNLDSLVDQTVGREMQIYILTSEGKVELGTGADLGKGEMVKSEVVIRAIRSKSGATAPLVHFSSSKENHYADHARPILDKQGNIKSIIYIRGNIEEVYRTRESTMRTIATGSIIAMALASVLGIIFSNMIIGPIKMLIANSKRLASGDYMTRIPVETADEIGELTQSFNYMASQLGISMALITSEKNKLEKIFEHMADGVMAFNRQGLLIHENSVCYDLIGSLNMAHHFDEIFQNIGMDIYFEGVLLGETKLNSEDLIVVEDRYLKMYFDIYLNAGKEPDGLVVVIQDVTKQQKLDEMRKEFVANVSHELRTPLTTVKSYTETLLDGAIEDRDMAIHFLGVMEKEADRMAALVQDLLELSKIDNKQIQLNFVPMNLRKIVEETLEAQQIHLQKAGHQLIYSVESDAKYFMSGDMSRIRQIIHNILSNAIKYSPDPGSLTVDLKYNQQKLKLSVKDTGLGIPSEDLERIFERFYRVDKARSRKLGGTGLGLSIAKELIELHNGTIHIESEVGKGTCVSLEFQALEGLERV